MILGLTCLLASCLAAAPRGAWGLSQMPDMDWRHVQELRAAAFAGNPEALSQFSRCQQVAEEGLSRSVLVLDAPLVQGMSQVRASEHAPFRQRQSSALQNAECTLWRGQGITTCDLKWYCHDHDSMLKLLLLGL